MKTNDPKAQAFLTMVKGAKEGNLFAFPSPLPDFDAAPTQAVLREYDGVGWWHFDLLWNGIKYAEVTAEIAGEDLQFETL